MRVPSRALLDSRLLANSSISISRHDSSYRHRGGSAAGIDRRTPPDMAYLIALLAVGWVRSALFFGLSTRD